MLVLTALTLPAQEAKVEAKDPVLELIRGMLREAEAARAEGEHEDARGIVREAMKACLELPAFEKRLDAHELLFEVGMVAARAGELRTAHDARQRVCDYRARTLPDDHPDLQRARNNLATTKYALGDLSGARALQERVLEVLSRTLPDDHSDLQRARNNLAVIRQALGDLSGARALREQVYEVWSRTLPDDHPDLQAARANLANTKDDYGDVAGARALREKVYEVRSRTLPDDHPDLQRARNNLAVIRQALGDLAGARALQEKVYEVWSRALPDDHPDLQMARNNLAITKRALGDLAGARALREKVYEVWSRTLPDDHPDLQAARANLAITEAALGDLAGACALQEKVLAVRSHTLPDDHPDLQAARNNLALTKQALGDRAGALQLARARGASAQRRLSSWILAPRELGAMAAQEQEGVDLLLTLAGGSGAVEAPGARADALVLAQTLRGAQTRAARRARAVDPERARPLADALRAAAAEVSRVAGEATEGQGELLEAKRRDRAERLSRAVQDKERLERDLAALAARAGHVEAVGIGPAELAATLPERSAAAAIVGFKHAAPDPEHPGRTIDEEQLAALVLARDGTVTFRSLGARAAVEDLVTALRTQVGAGRERGLSPKEGEDPLAVQKELRARVLDPILAAAGDSDTLWLSVDETLELVPLDALARDDGTPLGSQIVLRPLVSLFDLLDAPSVEVGDEPSLLTVGGLDYDTAAKETVAVIGNAATPVTDETRSGPPDSFRVLPSSTTEVKAIVSYFDKSFAGRHGRAWAGAEASKSALLSAASQATFVHLATHGYFAPESVKSTADAPTNGDAFGEGAITGLSPLALCGLALSGANLPPDDLGRHAGILTAEEILSLDLSRCYLVTLSACDTSLGVRRAGQGYASLRAALQGAGARYVLTSLWKVGDEATMELMVDFYRRLWVQKKEPHAALWEAKMAARQKGAPFRDWAGWVLTGR